MPYGYMHVDLEIVAGNIGEYIIPECRDACKKLWEHNIFTNIFSDIPAHSPRESEAESSYIWISLGRLSPENQEIFDRLHQQDPEHYLEEGKICVSRDAENIDEQLLKLSDVFEMQDVIEEGEGYMTVKDFIDNLPRLIAERAIEEPKFDEETGLVYLSPFYLALHQRYLDGKDAKSLDDIMSQYTKVIVRETGKSKDVEDMIGQMRATLDATGGKTAFIGQPPQKRRQEGPVMVDDGIIENPLGDSNKLSEEESLRMEVEGLRQENGQLSEQLSAVLDDNSRLHKENQELQDRFLRVREFMTNRLARIPFIGKRILREMKNELGEKELPQGRDDR